MSIAVQLASNAPAAAAAPRGDHAGASSFPAIMQLLGETAGAAPQKAQPNSGASAGSTAAEVGDSQERTLGGPSISVNVSGSRKAKPQPGEEHNRSEQGPQPFADTGAHGAAVPVLTIAVPVSPVPVVVAAAGNATESLTPAETVVVPHSEEAAPQGSSGARDAGVNEIAAGKFTNIAGTEPIHSATTTSPSNLTAAAIGAPQELGHPEQNKRGTIVPEWVGHVDVAPRSGRAPRAAIGNGEIPGSHVDIVSDNELSMIGAEAADAPGAQALDPTAVAPGACEPRQAKAAVRENGIQVSPELAHSEISLPISGQAAHIGEQSLPQDNVSSASRFVVPIVGQRNFAPDTNGRGTAPVLADDPRAELIKAVVPGFSQTGDAQGATIAGVSSEPDQVLLATPSAEPATSARGVDQPRAEIPRVVGRAALPTASITTPRAAETETPGACEVPSASIVAGTDLRGPEEIGNSTQNDRTSAPRVLDPAPTEVSAQTSLITPSAPTLRTSSGAAAIAGTKPVRRAVPAGGTPQAVAVFAPTLDAGPRKTSPIAEKEQPASTEKQGAISKSTSESPREVASNAPLSWAPARDAAVVGSRILQTGVVAARNATGEGTTPAPTSSSPTSAAAPTMPEPAHESRAFTLVQSARLIERAASAEMRVGVQTPELGKVEVHATLRDSGVGATLSVERPDIQRMFAAELPNLNRALDRHQIELQSVSLMNSMSDGAGSQGRGQQPAPQRQIRPQDNEPVPASQSDRLSSSAAAGAAASLREAGRLNLRA